MQAQEPEQDDFSDEKGLRPGVKSSGQEESMKPDGEGGMKPHNLRGVKPQGEDGMKHRGEGDMPPHGNGEGMEWKDAFTDSRGASDDSEKGEVDLRVKRGDDQGGTGVQRKGNDSEREGKTEGKTMFRGEDDSGEMRGGVGGLGGELKQGGQLGLGSDEEEDSDAKMDAREEARAMVSIG